MNDENMKQATETQKKITVKLKPTALQKATVQASDETIADVQIPAAPQGASPSATVKFNKQTVKASEPELPSAQELAKKTLKLSLPPKTGLPKPPAPAPAAVPVAPAPAAAEAAPATPAAAPAEAKPEATQAVKKPVLKMPKPAAPAAPAATQAVQRPTLNLTPKTPAAGGSGELPPDEKPTLVLTPKVTPAAEPAPAAEEAPAKKTLALPSKPKTEPPAAAASPTIHLQKAEKPETAKTDAATIQSEGLKPRAGGGSGLGLKKVESVAEEKLPENLKADGKKLTSPSDAVAKKSGKKDEPGGFFTAVTVLAFLFLLAGAYVMFAQYAGLWMPEMDAYTKDLPALPTGIFLK